MAHRSIIYSIALLTSIALYPMTTYSMHLLVRAATAANMHAAKESSSHIAHAITCLGKGDGGRVVYSNAYPPTQDAFTAITCVNVNECNQPKGPLHWKYSIDFDDSMHKSNDEDSKNVAIRLFQSVHGIDTEGIMNKIKKHMVQKDYLSKGAARR